MNIKITGSGSYIPNKIVKNSDFIDHEFLNEDGTNFPYDGEKVIEKFKNITGIEERRYADDNLVASDLAFFAAERPDPGTHVQAHPRSLPHSSGGL